MKTTKKGWMGSTCVYEKTMKFLDIDVNVTSYSRYCISSKSWHGQIPLIARFSPTSPTPPKWKDLTQVKAHWPTPSKGQQYSLIFSQIYEIIGYLETWVGKTSDRHKKIQKALHAIKENSSGSTSPARRLGSTAAQIAFIRLIGCPSEISIFRLHAPFRARGIMN